MEYVYYGNEHNDIHPVNNDYPGITDPHSLYDALSELWCEETCASWLRDKWTPENKTLGQCSISSFLAQDIFGGKVFGIKRPAGNFHCYNVVEGKTFDLTSEQFSGETLDYTDNPEQFREVHFKDADKKRRYDVLKKLLSDHCGKNMQ